MIFVTVGATLGFDRLLKMVDDNIKDKEVVFQIANSEYIPKKGVYHRFLSLDEMEFYINNSDFVISHAGVGTILFLIQLKKSAIIVPRYKKYNEAVDDHQLEISNYVRKYFDVCFENDVLRLENVKEFDPDIDYQKSILLKNIDSYVQSIHK
jgi:UDP-N-acetylglucosamine transferase subunit ALG13